MDNNWIDRPWRACEDRVYFEEVLRVLFYQKDCEAEQVTELNMDMFRGFCTHVRSTYQNLLAGAENPRQYMTLVMPYIALTKISLFPEYFPEYIDRPREVLTTFAELACDAIGCISDVSDVNDRQMMFSPDSCVPFSDDDDWDVLYDFERDTPEDVWNRVDQYIDLPAQESEE